MGKRSDSKQEAERAVYSAKQVAVLLGVSLGATYRGIQNGDIPSVKVGRQYLVPKSQFNAKLGLA